MVITAIVGYLIGSIPTALIVARFFNVDPRKMGDGNPGWWNMRALVGEKGAAVVLAGDVAKGCLAALVGLLMWGDLWWMPYLGVGAAMLGHAFPVFGRFRGGYSILTWTGGMLLISPAAGFAALFVGTAVGLTARRLAIGAQAAFVLFPVFQTMLAPRSHVALTGVFMTFIGLRYLYARSSVRKRGHAKTEQAAVSSTSVVE